MFYIYNKETCELLFTIEKIEKLEGVIVLENCLITNTPYSYPISKNGEIVEATKIDLYNKGIYKLQSGEIFNNETNTIEYIPENSKLIKNTWNEIKKVWEEGLTIEEQRQHWLDKSLEISRKIEEYKMLGFEGRQELVDLENKLQEYKLKYASTFEGEALAMDKHMNSTKPVK